MCVCAKKGFGKGFMMKGASKKGHLFLKFNKQDYFFEHLRRMSLEKPERKANFPAFFLPNLIPNKLESTLSKQNFQQIKVFSFSIKG